STGRGGGACEAPTRRARLRRETGGRGRPRSRRRSAARRRRRRAGRRCRCRRSGRGARSVGSVGRSWSPPGDGRRVTALVLAVGTGSTLDIEAGDTRSTTRPSTLPPTREGSCSGPRQAKQASIRPGGIANQTQLLPQPLLDRPPSLSRMIFVRTPFVLGI